jgi:hypothetical protein
MTESEYYKFIMRKVVNPKTNVIHLAFGFGNEPHCGLKRKHTQFETVSDERKITCKKCLKALNYFYVWLDYQERTEERETAIHNSIFIPYDDTIYWDDLIKWK